MEDKDLIRLSVKELIELGICPTCLNRRTSGAFMGIIAKLNYMKITI